MRTMPAPSLIAPDSRHCTSASCRHGSRSANMLPPLQPASTPRTPRTTEPTRYQRTPEAMIGRMRWTLLTTLQGPGRAQARWSTPRNMVKKGGRGANGEWRMAAKCAFHSLLAIRYSRNRPPYAAAHDDRGTQEHGSQAQSDIGAADVERDGVRGDAPRDLPQSRIRPGFPETMGEGLFHRLAGGGHHGVLGDAAGAAPDRAHRRPDRRSALMLSALDLARRIEAGALTPRAGLDLCAQAIAAREHEIGAFAALDLEAARRGAGRPDLVRSPLRGLAVGIKDIFDTADFPTAYGSPIYAGHRPKSDAAMVMLVRRAGGIVLGKTVTTEFASLAPAQTRNPRNPAHTPGGSSSGSAAAVAAGMLPLALGSQTGGSVIRPAAFCGVAGFKPSYRLLPAVGMKCFSWSLDTAGLFAAGVGDVAFAAAAISGRDLRVDQAPPSAPRVLLMRTHIWDQASDAMKGALETAARVAEAAGARVSDAEMPSVLEDAFHAHGTIQDYEAYRALAFEYD